MGFALRRWFDWKLRTRPLRLGERTLVMAIVNLTPDSFSGDGLLRGTEEEAIEAGVRAAVAAVDGGADIVDLGGESTRPNATPLPLDEEMTRLMPVLSGLLHERPQAIVSVDTFHAGTARAALAAGAEIINDVSGLLWDEAMAGVVAESGCGLVLMHTRGRPGEWGSQRRLAADEVVPLVLSELRERMASAVMAGIRPEQIVFDPGFGFGKRGAENFALLRDFAALHELGGPLLAGLSRKSFLGQAMAGLDAAGGGTSRLNATTAANIAAILGGAHIVRVHDVQPAREAAAIADALLG